MLPLTGRGQVEDGFIDVASVGDGLQWWSASSGKPTVQVGAGFEAVGTWNGLSQHVSAGVRERPADQADTGRGLVRVAIRQRADSQFEAGQKGSGNAHATRLRRQVLDSGCEHEAN